MRLANKTPPLLSFVKADTPERQRVIGRRPVGHIFLVVETANINRDCKRMKKAGVEFDGYPAQQPYGIEVTFKDL